LGKLKRWKYSFAILFWFLLVLAVAAFLYFDQHDEISALIQGAGLRGMWISLGLMALLCMTPLPSEGLLFLLLKVYGIYLGILLAWLGSMVGALIILIVSRRYGQKLMRQMITPERFKVVNDWVERKGTLGLLIARLLPLPAFAVNYIAGMIPSVRKWPYLWTAALTIAPYYLVTVLLFVGIFESAWLWLAAGGIVLALVLGVGGFCKWQTGLHELKEKN
jgi:uncharacterized membrane protein YdjX (TVP38/TMEM64 family)